MRINQHSFGECQKARQFFGIFIAMLVLAALPKLSFSANYYFSSSAGNDQYTNVQAQNPATPWKTLSKLNSIFYTLGAGDSVLFKRGDVFDGNIVVTKSGSAFAPICFGAYGPGNKPVISGLAGLFSWKSVGNGIYEAPADGEGAMLILNGVQQALGRYPNTGYLSYEGHAGNTSIIDNQLTGTTNWTGAEVVIRKNRWTIDKSTITAHAATTLTYAAGTKADPSNGYGYFIQKSPKTLDQLGEWYYDAARKVMMVYFGSNSPGSYTVRTSVVNTLVDIKSISNVRFENLAFIGASANAFHITSSNGIALNNCTIDYSGTEAILVSYSPNLKVENSTINHSMSGGINLDAGCASAVVSGNQIKNTAVLPGMGKSGSGTYEGITSFGDNTLIEKNTIDSTGYNGVYFGGNSAVVKNNVVRYFCLVKDDGAGIYLGDWMKTANKKIIGNIVLNGVGNAAGTNAPNSLQVEGIYIDDLSESVTIEGNTVAFCANNGIKIHNAKDINIFNNTVYNNAVQLRLEQDHYLATSTYIRNNNIKNNKFFSKTDAQPTSLLSSHQDDVVAFGTLDSNFYCRPINELNSIKSYVVRNGKSLEQIFDLAAWKAAYGKDANSKASPVLIPTYKVANLIGSNKFANGSFNSNVDGLYCYSTINDIKGTLATGVLDGGALKMSFSALSGNHVVVNMNVGNVTAGKKYVVRFSMLGSASGKIMDSYLRKSGSPYNAISERRNTKIGTVRTENELVLTATASEADASIIFEIDDPTGAVYLDNVQVIEANVTPVNPDEYLLFEYNPTSYVRTVSLGKTYVDVNNKTYSGSVSINPYSSVVLIATPTPVVTAKVAQTIIFSNLEDKTYGGVPVPISPVASSGLPVNTKIVSGPAVITDNVLKFNGYGTAVIEASQSGDERFEPASAVAQVANIMSVGNDLEKTTTASKDAELKAYPNPFSAQLTLEFTTPVSGNGSLKLYDLQGKFIQQIYSGELKASETKKFSVDGKGLGLTQGVYLVKLEANNKVLYQKVMHVN